MDVGPALPSQVDQTNSQALKADLRLENWSRNGGTVGPRNGGDREKETHLLAFDRASVSSYRPTGHSKQSLRSISASINS